MPGTSGGYLEQNKVPPLIQIYLFRTEFNQTINRGNNTANSRRSIYYKQKICININEECEELIDKLPEGHHYTTNKTHQNTEEDSYGRPFYLSTTYE